MLKTILKHLGTKVLIAVAEQVIEELVPREDNKVDKPLLDLFKEKKVSK